MQFIGLSLVVEKTQEVYFGVEETGNLGSRGYLLTGVEIDSQGYDDTLKVFVEIEALTDGHDWHGGLLHDAHSGASHPVFLEARGTVGADDDEGSIGVDGMA